MKVEIFTCNNVSTVTRGFEIISEEINAWVANQNENIEIIDIKTNVIYPTEDSLVCTSSVIYK